MKGAVISSEADPDKNKLSTDTLTFSDIQNKAEYSASSVGVNLDTRKTADAKDAGLTPAIGTKATGDADSTTKSAIAEGTIEVRHGDTDLSNLSRDTANSLNALSKIFDKKTVAEQQELAKVFGEVAFKAIGDLADSQYEKAATDEEKAKWLDGGEYKIALHALVGGIMSDMGGSSFASGVSEAAQHELSKITDPALRQWASAIVGATATKVVGGNSQSGASTAASGTKNNDVGHPGKDLLAIDPTEKTGNYYQLDGKFYQVDADGNPQEISPDQAVGQRVWAVTEDGTAGWWTVDDNGSLNWAGATGERRYEDGQVWQIGTDGKDYAVQVSVQEEISLENQKIINENDDLLINAIIARGGLELIGKASLFEKLISKLPAGERVALVKTQAVNVAEQNGWVKDTKLSKMNSRDIYQDPNTGNLYSVDTQHGRFEMTNSKGKHLGEVNFDLTQTKAADKSGSHNIITK